MGKTANGTDASGSASEGKKSDEGKMSSGMSNLLFADVNTYRYWLVMALCGFLVYHLVTGRFSILWGFLTILVSGLSSILTDYLYYFWAIPYYDPHATIVRGYASSCFFNDTLHSVGLDYGFNYYNGDYKKTRSQAQRDKFEHAVKQIGIRPGDRVIDVGCGCGDWLYYLQTEMKCKVAGVNITDAQAEQARKRGLTIFTTNWKDIKRKPEINKVLYGQFDVVTFWDTVEHYVPFGQGIWRRDFRASIYQDMFDLAGKLTDPDSKLKKVWISCLHMRYETMSSDFHWNLRKLFFPTPDELKQKGVKKTGRKGKLDTNPVVQTNPWGPGETLWKWYSIYLLDKFHSGYYPSYYEEKGVFHDELVDNAEVKGYELQWREDTTYDYYMTSKLNPTHFGRHRFKYTPGRFLGMLITVLLDPYWVHRILWFSVEAWMEQFDPEDFDKSFVILWWLVFQLDNKGKKKSQSTQNGQNGVH